MSEISGINNSYYPTTSSTTSTSTSNANDNKTGQTTQKDEMPKETYTPSPQGAAAYDRSKVVAQLKADAEAHSAQLTSMVQQMMKDQGATIGKANDMWRFLASGNFTVDAATKAQAQKDIAEDGYWGVSQTSQRIFDFAMALTGGDGEKMEEMRKAFEKGFKMATKTWGQELPDISQRTYDATEKLFDDYAESLKTTIN